MREITNTSVRTLLNWHRTIEIYNDSFAIRLPFVPPLREFKEESILIEKGISYRIGDYVPIPYQGDRCMRIYRYLKEHRLVPYTPVEARDLTPEELNALNYIILSLDAFYSQDNKEHVNYEQLIGRIMELEGAKFLKRQRLKSFLVSNESSLVEKPSWWSTTPHYYIGDIGEVYNFNYAMYWEAPDEQEYLLSQTPLNLDEEVVDEFKELVNRIISDCNDFNYVDPEEIILRVSSSKALYKGESVPHFARKSNVMSFSSKRKAGRRVLITTGPGAGRDAIINEIDDLNTIQYINENVRNFLEKNFRKHLLLGNSEVAKRRYFRTCKKNRCFYARDIKKEGITKPKYILKIILEALRDRYPDCEAFKFTDFFSGPWFQGDVGHRGHGLGMANELTTLMQILLFYFTNQKLGEDGTYIVSTSSFFLNDDAIIFFKEDDENIEDFIDMDFYLCNCLGIMAQRDKSFFSKHCAVFCEMYYSDKFESANVKQSYQLREERIILRSGSILEAKFLLGNLKGSLQVIEENLRKCFYKLGCEFSPKELNWPLSMGGLRPTKLRGTDFALKYLEEIKSINLIYKAYTANKLRRLWGVNKFLRTYQPPIVKKYPGLLNLDDSILSKIGIGSNYDLACQFFRPSKEHKFHSSLEKLRKKRLEIFKETSSPTYADFVKEYVTNSMSNNYLHPQFIEREIEVKLFFIKNFRDPYKIDNPITAFLNKHNFISRNDIPKTEWGLYYSDSTLLNEKSVFARARTMNTLSLIDRFEEDFEYDILVFPKNVEDIEDFCESYPKPFLTSELVTKGNKLPIPKKEFRNPVLKIRKEVFNGYLKYYHVILAQTCTWQELNNIIIFERWKPDFEYDLDFWLAVLERMRVQKEKDLGNIKDESTSSDNDEDDPFTGGLYLGNLSQVKVSFISDEERGIEKVHIEKLSISSDDSVEELLEEDVMTTVLREKKERDSKNIFLKAHGELEDGDTSVYGSTDWVKWLVEQDFVTLNEYYAADSDLADAMEDMLSHKRSVIGVSDIVSISDKIENLERSVKWSWISHYYYEWIHTEVVEEEINYNVDDLFS